MSALLGAGITAGASILGSVAQRAGNLIDVANSPNQLRSIGKVPEAVLMNGTKPFDEIYQIDDWNIVADTYEKTGYRVNVIVNERYHDNFQDWLNRGLALWDIRHFYNPIQFSFIDLDPAINIPVDLVTDFEMRLKNGLRFWNVDNPDVNMSDFKYDNVEEAYI